MSVVKVSPKYQVVIPQKIREALGIEPGQKILALQYLDRIEHHDPDPKPDHSPHPDLVLLLILRRRISPLLPSSTRFLSGLIFMFFP